jgi:hypothetical protein
VADRPRNIQLFDHTTGVVLTKLYEAFPMPIDLKPLAVGFEVAQQIEEDDRPAMVGLAQNTIAFLEREGLVHVRVPVEALSGAKEFLGATLTSKRLSIRGNEASPLAMLDPSDRKTYGERLRSSLTDPEMLAALVKAILSAV